MPEDKVLLYSKQLIEQKTREIAEKISRDYQGKKVILIGVLKGSFIFLADLVRFLTIPVTIDFVMISSYGSKASSSGELKITKDIEIPLWGKAVIIVEDIVDTGLTLFKFTEILKARKPESVKICALIDKIHRREKEVEIDYPGFQVKEGFLVGYGLDFDEKYRQLPGIYAIRE